MGVAPTFPLFAVAVVAALVTGRVAHRRSHVTPAATALAGTLYAVAGWSAFVALTHVALPLDVLVLAANAALLFVHLTSIGFYALARVVADRTWRPTARTALLAVAPALTVVAMLTDPWHGLFVNTAELTDPYRTLRLQFGPLFLAHLAYCYVLFGWTVAILLRARRGAAPVFRRQLTALLLAGAIPMVGNVFSVLIGLSADHPLAGKDYTPLFFTLTGVIDAWALLRLGLMQLVPVARTQVVDTIADAVLVVDPEDRVVDVNPAGEAVLRRLRPGLPGELVGLPVAAVADPALLELGAEVPDGAARAGRGTGRVVEVLPGLHLDLRVTTLRGRDGSALGTVVVGRDVSEAECRRRELVAVNDRLREQVETIDRLRAELAEESVRDALTGLHNRRHLERVLRATVDDAREARGAVGVVLMDVDHFKAVNDTYGHPVGDVALQTVARALGAGLRAGDTLARLGGEEFVAVLPGADPDQTWNRAQQLRRLCETTAVRTDEHCFQVTLSAGVATYPHHGEDWSALLTRADEALYAAKAAGRNRVEVADAGSQLGVG
ncbi:diguanylate cyclase [Thalassiella azotivora]